MNHYSDQFYSDLETGSLNSATEIVPILLNYFNPDSIIDVGCGTGTWLSVFMNYGVTDVIGLDGAHIEPGMLKFPKKLFMPWDLSKPIRITKKFDIAVSLEVAEHLSESDSKSFVKLLTSIAPIVIFSAAIPFQGGTNHINEQWPDYWAKLFLERDFFCFDIVRNKIWNNPKVCWWYAQNIMIFAKKDEIEKYPNLKHHDDLNERMPISLVHPVKYMEMANDFEKNTVGHMDKYSTLQLAIVTIKFFFKSMVKRMKKDK